MSLYWKWDPTSSELVWLCSQENYHPLICWELLKNMLMFTSQQTQSASLLPQKVLNVSWMSVFNDFGTLISKIRNIFQGWFFPHCLHTHAFWRHCYRLFLSVVDWKRMFCMSFIHFMSSSLDFGHCFFPDAWVYMAYCRAEVFDGVRTNLGSLDESV